MDSSVAVANGGSDNVSILSGVTPAPTSPEAVGSHPTSIVTGNLNGDATIGDLAVANRGSDAVTILLNDVPPPIPPPQARPHDPVKLKKCIKRAKKKHKKNLGQKKAIKKCKKRFG